MSASRATDFATDFAIDWPVEGAIVRCGATRLGTGPPALMLPALSSISTRAEMRPLQEVLSERFETLAVDWPAFGDHPKPACRWTPAMLDAYIGHILTDVAPRPSVLFAAGHAAGYALRAVTRAPDEAGRRVLIAPTWRGPFPTMLGRRPGWLARLRGAVDAPALGPLVYALTRRIHVLVKPMRPDIVTNLVINTDRRTYHLELRATASAYMASVSWQYPEDALIALKRRNTDAEAAEPIERGVALEDLQFRYRIEGDRPPWRPIRAFDDGRQVFVEFPRGIGQGEMPPLFVIGPEGDGELVNYRVRRNYIVVDRLFAAAELKLGDRQQRVRIVRTDGVTR